MTSTSVLTKWAADGQFLAPVRSVLNSSVVKAQSLLAPWVQGLSDPGNQSDALTPDNTTLLDLLQTAIAATMNGSSSASTALKQAAITWNRTIANPYG
jgi:ABC-type glycerol-3-phosphate transport system substrate-binding protein